MKFYVVTYRDDYAPEGCGGQYFRTKKEAEQFVSALRVRLMTPQECAFCGATIKPPQEQCPQCGDGWYYTKITLESIELKVIELTGTTKEMCWQALNHQIIP